MLDLVGQGKIILSKIIFHLQKVMQCQILERRGVSLLFNTVTGVFATFPYLFHKSFSTSPLLEKATAFIALPGLTLPPAVALWQKGISTEATVLCLSPEYHLTNILNNLEKKPPSKCDSTSLFACDDALYEECCFLRPVWIGLTLCLLHWDTY